MEFKPKYANALKVEFKLSRRSKAILVQYAEYSDFEKSEIIEKLLVNY